MSLPAGVTIIVNGTDRAIPAGMTVDLLLEALGLSRVRVAVEINGRVVRREELGRRVLAERDRLEVVQFVGGG